MIFEHSSIKCPVCGSTTIVFDPDRGEHICASCGTVISDRVIDYGKEWRTFSSEDAFSKARTGRSLTNAIHDRGLTTSFSLKGFKFKGEMRKKVRNMARLQRKIRISKKDKLKVIGLKYLNDYATKLGIPNHVREEAARILQSALEKVNVKEKTVRAMAVASILMACRTYGLPYTLRSISRSLGISIRNIWHAEKRIVENVKRIVIKTNEPKDFIPVIVKKLGLSSKVQYLAALLTYLARKREIASGRGPIGLAAATVYMASILLDEKKTQQEVASVCDITDVTIRNRYGDLVEKLDIEVLL